MWFNQELICTFPWQEVLKAEKEKKSAVPDKGSMVCNERLENDKPKASPYCKVGEPKFLGFTRADIQMFIRTYDGCIPALENLHKNVYKGVEYNGFYHCILSNLWEDFLESGVEVTVEDYKRELNRTVQAMVESSTYSCQDEDLPNTRRVSKYGPYEATIDSNGTTVKL